MSILKYKDIGFLIIQMNNDPVYDRILQTIKIIETNNPSGQTIIFNSQNEKINTYNLPILHVSQAQFFDGLLMVFDLPSLIMTKSFPNLKQRILYTNMAHWTMNTQTRFSEWQSLYEQNNLDIITSTEQLYDLYNICWKKPLGISETFSYEELCKLI
jgi:hypothetical protein